MKQTVKLRNERQLRFSFQLCALLLCLWCGPSFSNAAERFGDIDITPITLATGETHHGYREFRILIENHSLKSTHQVTLVFPERPYNSGNSISRLSRTVAVGPSSSAMVPLWQPPLPINGNNQMRLLVDDDVAGTINLPDASRHLTSAYSGPAAYRYGSSPAAPTAILVSRSLNFDDLNHAFNSKVGVVDYSAQMATGPRDSSSGMTPTAWMPDPSSSGLHWIELNYAAPQTAKGVRIWPTMPLPSSTKIIITGISGTNLFQTNTAPTRGRMNNHEISFALTAEPVKTVRLEFGPGPPGAISIDAVELIGASGGAWASSALASSDASAAYGSGSGRGLPSRGLLRSELPMSQWSESWLSYSPYDAIALNQADLKMLSPAAFNALWSYVECGGNLFIFGATSVPDPWRSFPKNEVEHGESRNIGLGRCFIFEQENISKLTSGTVKEMTDAIDFSGRYWQALPDEDAANQSFPVIANFRVPVRSTVFIMLLFVIAIGPVNLIVLSRMNRRTWLLWTIPAISFVTCLSVFAYSFLREGVTPDTRISGLTILNQSTWRAASIGYTAFYCPLTPSQGLFFGSDTEATPLVERWNYRSGTDREMDWTQGQHLGRGWVSARVPAHFELRKSETRRERLEIENQNGQLTVVNGLGATIQSLWLADTQSRIYSATNILAGQKAALTLTTETLKKNEQLGARTLLEKCGAQADLSDATTYLLPNTYLAEMNANPFFENGLGPKAQSSRTKSHAVVFGTLEQPAKP